MSKLDLAQKAQVQFNRKGWLSSRNGNFVGCFSGFIIFSGRAAHWNFEFRAAFQDGFERQANDRVSDTAKLCSAHACSLYEADQLSS